ncbi:MAG: hypothetical protein HY000_07340 [Planctomycetes bacterium]|nr:hypothetical protein [Planctomycetota bacterium]
MSNDRTTSTLATTIPVDVLDVAARLGVSEILSTVMDLTESVFECGVEARIEEDPEIAGDVRISLLVRESTDTADQLRRRSEWSRRMFDLAHPRSHLFRLSAELSDDSST